MRLTGKQIRTCTTCKHAATRTGDEVTLAAAVWDGKAKGSWDFTATEARTTELGTNPTYRM